MSGAAHTWKAFTVIELLVVSAISVIIASTVFKAIENLQYQFMQYQDQVSLELNTAEIRNLLRTDFAEAKYIKLQEEQLTLEFPKYTIKYEFVENGITRQKSSIPGAVQKFAYNWLSLQGYWKRQEQTVEWIDALHIQSESASFFITAPLTAAQEINLNYGN